MSALIYVRDTVLRAALSVLPPQMDTPAARAMLLAIGLQESRMTHRRQIGGPARGFWQFEIAGVRGVMRHQASRQHASAALRQMAYGETDEIAYASIEHNDVLACVFARLLLWTHPLRLPTKGEAQYAWAYYLDTWRPGKPHRHTWDAHFSHAWMEGAA